MLPAKAEVELRMIRCSAGLTASRAPVSPMPTGCNGRPRIGRPRTLVRRKRPPRPGPCTRTNCRTTPCAPVYGRRRRVYAHRARPGTASTQVPRGPEWARALQFPVKWCISLF